MSQEGEDEYADDDCDYADGCYDDEGEEEYYFDNYDDQGEQDNVKSQGRSGDNAFLACEHTLFREQKAAELIDRIKKRIRNIAEDNGISLGRAQLSVRASNYDLDSQDTIPYQILDDVFLTENPALKSSKNTDCCLLCDETLNKQNKYCLECNHNFCKDCFGQYLKTCLQSGIEYLSKTCPMEGCRERIGLKEGETFLTQAKEQALIDKFFLQDVISKRSGFIQCPQFDCEEVFEKKAKSKKTETQVVNMKCGSCMKYFCSSCSEDAHLPCRCDLLQKWLLLIEGKTENSNSLNAAWLKVNTKPCPKCKVLIEKNKGCMHMKCYSCNYHFCWLCLGEYINHESFYACNKYKPESANVSVEEELLKKYTFYSDRFRDHIGGVRFSENEAELHLLNLRQYLKVVGENDEKQSAFYEHSFNVLIEAKKAAAYTYPIGFYIKEDKKRDYFEFLQGELEQNLNNFEDLLTTVDFQSLLIQSDLVLRPFFEYQQKVTDKTNKIKNYLVKMLADLSDEIPDFKRLPSSVTKQNSIRPALKKGISKKQSSAKPSYPCEKCHIQQAQNDYGLCNACLETSGI